MAAIVRFVSFGALALVVAGCASVELAIPGLAPEKVQVSAEDTRQRSHLEAALSQLEQQPWDDASAEEVGLTQLLFGSGGPSARAQAQGYIESIGGDAVLQVRRDLETTLSAVWNVAHTGRDAVSSMQPLASDLRTIEQAIITARRCRLVYAETLTVLSREDASITRNEVRRVKQRFNQAIMELGRTADALSLRLQRDPNSSSFALSESAY